MNEGEWIVEGDVPEPVVMFIQIIRYSRYGFDHKGKATCKEPSKHL